MPRMCSRPPAALKSAIVTELALLAAATTATSGDLNRNIDVGGRITRSTLMPERISERTFDGGGLLLEQHVLVS